MSNVASQQKIRADQVKRAIGKRHWQDFFLTEVKTGATHTNNELLIFDALAVKKSWANPCITGYEVKVDRSDFTRDNKWPGYMAYCNLFSFVCPAGLMQLDELPADVGLIYYNAEKDCLTTKRKAVYRNIEMPEPLLYYIIMNRLESDRHPFFSSNRDYIEAFLIDKDARKELGRRFGMKVAEEISVLRQQVAKLEREKERESEELQLFIRLSDVLREYGINVNRWGSWDEELRTAITGGGVNPKVLRELNSAVNSINALKTLIIPKVEEVSHG